MLNAMLLLLVGLSPMSGTCSEEEPQELIGKEVRREAPLCEPLLGDSTSHGAMSTKARTKGPITAPPRHDHEDARVR